MKIAVIGPVYPYKGGISHYTGMLVKNLREKHEAAAVSYSLQYPKILFKKEQRDYDNKTFLVDNTEFIINTANPFNWKKTAKRLRELQPDIVIFQWWHPYFAPCYMGIIAGLKDIKIGFICHNVFPHERFFMDRLLTRGVLSKGDFFITHSKQDTGDLLSIKPDAVCEQAVHPTYNAFKLEGMSKEAAREKLGLKGEKTLLFFGFVRKYKGLMTLIKALPHVLAQYPDIKLLIVGDFGKDKQEYIDEITQNNIWENIQIHDGYIPDKEVEKYFAACDLVVLPYDSATQSGIVQIAYGFEKPVVATNVGGLPEVVIDAKTGYVVPKGEPKALAEAVVRYFMEEKQEEFTRNVRKEAWRYEWDRMRETIERLAMGAGG